jgi:protocatechuate 3,4-dioxygenase beta subunit
MRSLTRRTFIGTTIGAAASLKITRAARALGMRSPVTACTLAPEQEQGPFYVSGEMLRADIAEGQAGVPLDLHIAILDARTCEPLAGAAVDLWHCDAMGLYSGFTKSNIGGPPEFGNGGPGGPPPDRDGMGGPPQDGRPPGPPPGMNGGGPPPAPPQTDKLTFLRGIQITGADGTVRFRTIFPGFYQGRTNHIHFKVRLGDTFSEFQSGCCAFRRSDNGDGHVSHVGQIFFPEEVAVELMSRAPYNEHKIHRTTQAGDGVFNRQGGAQMIAKPAALSGTDVHAGLSASIAAAVDPTATPAPVGFGGPGGPGRGGPPPNS